MLAAPAKIKEQSSWLPSGVRRASDDDNEALCQLMANSTMDGAMQISARRDPDYFALYRMQRGESEVYVSDRTDGQGLAGMATTFFRRGYHQGASTTVGYLADLRSGGFDRRSRRFPLVFRDGLSALARQHGCETFHACVMGNNQGALRALTRRRGRRQSQPAFSLFRRYDGVAVHFLLPPGRPAPLAAAQRRGLSVQRMAATSDGELAELRRFVAADHRNRPMGYAFDEGELEHRIASWPGYTLDNTYVCRDGAGDLVGTVNVWDASAVRRYRVAGLSRGMTWANRGYNAAAWACGAPRLPGVGEDFSYIFLTTMSIAGDDPVVFRMLVDRIYADFHGRGYQFLLFPFFEHDGEPDPLEEALSGSAELAPPRWGRVVRRMPFMLFTVSPEGPSRVLCQTGRPGFEIALA